MTHPIVGPNFKGLRNRVKSLVHAGLHRTAATNILFVCGGNTEDHLRAKFVDFAAEHMPEYLAFRPEAAQSDFFKQDQENIFNLAHFEKLVSEISSGVVLFAESPGSFAEVGLFSALDDVKRKTLVILDIEYQGHSNFLSLGPVALITKDSIFGAALQLNFKDPNFDPIKLKISDRVPPTNLRRVIKKSKFSQLTSPEIMALIWFYVHICKVCSYEDILYLFRSSFSSQVKEILLKQILSVLFGAEILERHHPLNLITLKNTNLKLAQPSADFIGLYHEVLLEITDIVEEFEDAEYQGAMLNAY